MVAQTHYLLPETPAPVEKDLAGAFTGYDFAAINKVLGHLKPAAVIAEIRDSGLRGRGGAAFSTGIKWETVQAQPETERYIVANAEEGEPGTFKDRLLLEQRPLALLEAMLICGYAVAAGKGYIYLNHHYKPLADQLEKLLAMMRDNNLLGHSILGSEYDFDIEIRVGRARYVSGEETALFQAIEGRRAEPTGRPPYPTEQGLWGKPTIINNIETFVCIPLIINRGSDWFAGIGPAGSHGPKLFCLTGDIKQAGVYESAMDVSLQSLIDWAGGMDGGDFKFALVSGPSGVVYLPDELNKPLSIENGIGNGTIIVCNDRRCAYDIGCNTTGFFYAEHCGQCLPGRQAMPAAMRLMTHIADANGLDEVHRRYENLHQMLMGYSKCSLCSSGTGITPSLMQHFRQDFEAHIQGHCRLCGEPS